MSSSLRGSRREATWRGRSPPSPPCPAAWAPSPPRPAWPPAGSPTPPARGPRVGDTVTPRPVVAAGGIADARGVVAALALGAKAAMLGTRFLASDESRAHPLYKQRLLEANEGDTLRTVLFGYGWPNA